MSVTDSSPAAPDDAVPPETGAAEPDATRKSRKKRSKGRSLARETAIIVVSALVISWLLKTFLVQAFFIPSGSMEATLEPGDRVLVNKLVPGPFDLHRGDVVVFSDPGGWLQPTAAPQESAIVSGINSVLTTIGVRPSDSTDHLIKRVIGLPGDHVVCCTAAGQLSVNGEPITEPYLFPGDVPSEQTFDITVPADSLWVMGDHRSDSWDSRFHQEQKGGGSVPMSDVVGVAFSVVLPIDRFGMVNNAGDTFAKVPNP